MITVFSSGFLGVGEEFLDLTIAYDKDASKHETGFHKITNRRPN
jgi:hypothetical protein